MNSTFNISIPQALRRTPVRRRLLLALCCGFSFTIHAKTIFVKADAGGDNNGTTWEHAYTDLQAAIDAAVINDVIFVASGTYRPSTPPYGGVSEDPRDRAFALKVRVSLYGGFAGTEATLEERLFNSAGPTILSGDLNGDDGPGFANRSDNSYHVVTGYNLAQATGTFTITIHSVTFDGFTVTGGNADGEGTLTGGLYSFNRAYGGGLYAVNSSATYLNGTGNVNFLTVSNCTFTENLALAGGGAIYTLAVTGRLFTLSVNNSVFTGNMVTGDPGDVHGGGAIYAAICALTVNDASFTGNKVPNRLGGAILAVSSGSTSRRSFGIFNSTFTENEAVQGGAINGNAYTQSNINGCTFTDNKAKSVEGLIGSGGAVICISGAPGPHNHYLYYSVFTGNTAESTGGALTISRSSDVEAVGCVFRDNAAGVNGGAVSNNSEPGTAKLYSSVFTGNTAGYGGAVFSSSVSSNTLTAASCLFVGNTSTGADQPHGGAITNSTNSTALISQCTFAGNQATGHDDAAGAVLNRNNGNLTMEGNILWNNTGGANAGNPGLVDLGTGTVQVTRNLVQGGFAGEGNIDADPLFADESSPIGPDGLWGTDDDGLRLQYASPAINAALGITVQLIGISQVDFGAIQGVGVLTSNPSLAPRIRQGKPDMGAYENLGFVLATETGIHSAPDVIDTGDWVYYYEEETGELVLAVNSADPALTVTGELRNSITTLTEPFGTEYDQVKVIRRSWSAAGGFPTGTRTVRFFYDPQDLGQLGDGITIGGLAAYKVDGSDPYDADAGEYTQYAVTTGPASPTRFRTGIFQGIHYVEFVVNDFSSGSIALLPEGALPVTLISFTARKQEAGVQLTWKTTEEVNASHFDIERSTDAKTWKKIGAVKARGESRTAENYTFTDQLWDVTTSTNHHIYYRLKQLDRDGRYTYSAIRNVDREGRRIRFGPNPAVDRVTVSGLSGGEVLRLYDTAGRLVFTGRAAGNSADIALESFSPGIYILSVINGDTKVLTGRIIRSEL